MENNGTSWRPREIFIHEKVKDDPITQHFLDQCPGIPVQYLTSSKPQNIAKASYVLRGDQLGLLDKVLLGKQIAYIAPAGTAVDTFTMPDDRMMCPHFERLKLASNGCFYQCDWCYLKLTYRAAFPFITVRVQYDRIKEQLKKRLSASKMPVIFNTGELADSLSMEHLTRAGQEFIPWFGQVENGYLYMLTKSDNVDAILGLPHNGHTIIAWSLNNEVVSRTFEVGAPSFERRLAAAKRVQDSGYRVRVRLDPIVPFDGWKEGYAETIKRVFNTLSPETVTIGTLRFEEQFYKMRDTLLGSPEMKSYLDEMEPMFEPRLFVGKKRPKSGKWSFSEERRIDIFLFMINEIKRYSNCPIALCKESSAVWNAVGLDLSRCYCACQLAPANMTVKDG